ncbi:MAG: hypothetical protein ACOZDD_05515 [Bacteroidota bacterium]
MEYNKKMEVFSNLVKWEKLTILEDKIVPGTLVFESQDPFPGYYSDVPDSPPPVYLYLALDKPYRLEEILRAIQLIQPHFEEHFDAGKGIATIVNEEIPVIRLRHFGNYDIVAPLQEAFNEAGIGYLKKTKKQGQYEALVRIVKMLYLKQVEPHVFIDLKEDFHGYILIPSYLSWKQFEKITKQVKYNWFGSKFDAAYGSFYHDTRLYEFVRIYSNKLDTDYLQDIRSLYLEKLSHPLS